MAKKNFFKTTSKVVGGLAMVLALVFGLVLAGCDDGSSSSGDDPSGGGAKFPESWVASAGTSLPYWLKAESSDSLMFRNDGSQGEMVKSPYSYRLKSFTGDGTTTGSFKFRALSSTQEETGDEKTVEYSLSGDTLTLTFGDGYTQYSGNYTKRTSYSQ